MNSTTNQKYYFDANALVKYYKEEPGSLQIKRLVSNAKPILISPLTLVECVSVFMTLNRKKALNKKRLNTILKLIDKNVNVEEIETNTTTRPFHVMTMQKEIFSLAKHILVQNAHTFAIGSNDALHLAIIQNLALETVMVTSDKSMQKVCERLQIPFYDPETH